MAHAQARRASTSRPEHAIRWLTANPAKALGIDDQTGTLEPGKMADVVLWNGTPFSVYAQAEQVYVDGALMYDRSDQARQPKSDFMLGLGGVAMKRLVLLALTAGRRHARRRRTC